MLFARDGHVGAKNGAEHVELGAAKALASRGGGADGAVIFDQQERAVLLLVPSGHVAFR